MSEEKRITNGNRCQIKVGCLYAPGHKQKCATHVQLETEREEIERVKKVEKK